MKLSSENLEFLISCKIAIHYEFLNSLKTSQSYVAEKPHERATILLCGNDFTNIPRVSYVFDLCQRRKSHIQAIFYVIVSSVAFFIKPT